MTYNQMVALFLLLLALLLIDLWAILWVLENRNYELRRRKLLTWPQRIRITLVHIGVRLKILEYS